MSCHMPPNDSSWRYDASCGCFSCQRHFFFNPPLFSSPRTHPNTQNCRPNPHCRCTECHNYFYNDYQPQRLPRRRYPSWSPPLTAPRAVTRAITPPPPSPVANAVITRPPPEARDQAQAQALVIEPTPHPLAHAAASVFDAIAGVFTTIATMLRGYGTRQSGDQLAAERVDAEPLEPGEVPQTVEERARHIREARDQEDRASTSQSAVGIKMEPQ